MANKVRKKKGFLFLLVLVGCLVFLFFVSEANVWRVVKTERKVAMMREEVERLKAENTARQEKNESLKNDPETLEKIAREEYGMQKDGEKVWRFVKKNEEETVVPAQQ